MNVLVVDDNLDSRMSVAKFLRKLNYNVDECKDGLEALKYFLNNNYQLVLSDVKMPKMTGIELLKAISASPGWNSVDVVLFTGHDELEYAIEALRAGAYDYLTKPINVNELARITENIGRRRMGDLEKRDKTKVMLVNIRTVSGQGFKYLLEEAKDFFIVSQVASIEECIYAINGIKPDVVILDMDNCKGISLGLKKIKASFPELNVVALYSIFSEKTCKNLQQYVNAFLSKNIEAEEFLFTMKKVGQGFKIIEPQLQRNWGGRIEEEYSNIEKLTEKELQVLEGLVEGLTNKEIAEKLFLSPSTIRSYVSSILQKWNLPNRAAAAAYGSKFIKV